MKNFVNKVSILITTFLLCFSLVFSNAYIGLRTNRVNVTEDVVAEASTDYYASLNTDLTGSEFREDLAELITSTHKNYTSYDGLKSVFAKSDADPDNSGHIIWFYSGTSIPYNPNANMDSGDYPTNREHVWPKNGGKAFAAKSGPGSDAHHLRPANSNLNSSRGDNSFGEVAKTNGNIVKENGSTSYKNLCYQANSTFYPGEGYRGATARILMYMQTRWGEENNLKFVLGNGDNKTIGDIATLLKWHYEEPPTEAEIVRNEYVYSIQGNRNPFIDHPEYATMIYCYDGESYNDKLQSVAEQYDKYSEKEPVSSITILASDTDLNVGDTLKLTVTATPVTADKQFSYSSSNPSVATVNDEGVITAVSKGSATITVLEENSGVTKTITVDVFTNGVSENTKNFKELIKTVKESDASGIYSAMINAISCYDGLSDVERVVVATSYESLINYIEEYNRQTSVVNSSLKDASETALSPFKSDKKKNLSTNNDDKEEEQS